MQKNVSGQKIGAQLVSATDGSAFTGSVTVSVCGDAGTQATGSVGSGACTHEGNGYHTYAPAQAETNYDLIAFTFTGTGAIPVTIQVYTRWNANATHQAGTALTARDIGASVLLSSGTGTGQISLTSGIPAVNVTQFGGTNGTFASGIPAVNATQISGDSTAADRLEASLDQTIYINHDGNNATSGTALQAAAEGNPRCLIIASAGDYEMDVPLEPAANVVVRGAGVDSTRLIFANGFGGGSGDITPASGVAFEDMTIKETADGIIVVHGAAAPAVQGFRLERVFLDSPNLECLELVSANASSFILKDVDLHAYSEWGFNLKGSAHVMRVDGLRIHIPSNNSEIDYKAFSVGDGAMLIGNDIQLFTGEGSDAGRAFAVLDNSVVILANSAFGLGEINIDDASGFCRMTNCEFNRDNVTGHPDRLDDVFSPVVPLVRNRKLGVGSDGVAQANVKQVADVSGNATEFALWLDGTKFVPSDIREIASEGNPEAILQAAAADAIEAAGLPDATKAAMEANGSLLKGVSDKLPSDGAKMAGEGENAKTLDDIEVEGGGVVIPVNQAAVPNSRTWLLKATENGLRGETSLTMRVGEEKVFAVDFREDLATNGRLADVSSIEIADGQNGGVTFAETDNDPGVDKTQAKVTITAVTAGTYEIECDVDYQPGSGGGSASGVVTLIVTE